MQVVALDWDSDSVRVAVASSRPTGAVLSRVVSISLCDGDKTLIEELRAALPEVRWAKARLVVAVGGDRVGFRLLKLPPTPDNELPDMVQLMAEREFGGGDGVVDYIPLTGDASSSRTVLAARAGKKTLDAVHKLAEQLEATVSKVVLRACGAGSLASRLDETVRAGAVLVVAPAGPASSSSGSDLVVLDDGLPAIIRTARGESDADIRRTISAAAHQLGRPVSRTISFAEPDEGLAKQLQAAALRWRLPPSDSGAIAEAAGVVGVALDEAEKQTPVVDLLHARRAQVDPAPRRRQALMAGLAASLVLAIAWFGYRSLARYEDQTAELRERIAQENKAVEEMRDELDQVAAIDRWLADDVNWLDELEQLSRRMRPEPLSTKEFPEEEDVMLTLFTASAAPGRLSRGGTIALDAVAREASASTRLEQRLSDDSRQVEQGSLDQSGDGKYVWRLKPTVRITPPEEEDAR